MEQLMEIVTKTIEYFRLLQRSIKRDPAFGFLTVVSYLNFCFTITSISGGWANYRAEIEKKESLVKIGLFNSAIDGKWRTYSFGECVGGDKNDKQISVCNARVAAGALLMISLFLTLFSSIVLTAMLTKSISETSKRRAKNLVMTTFSLSGIINLIAVIVGSTVIYQVIILDPRVNDLAYGVGFQFSCVNFALYVLLVIGLYLLVAVDGRIQTIPRLAKHQKSSIEMPSFY